MSTSPNGGLITETNQQYYAGAQGFTTTAPQQVFTVSIYVRCSS